MLRLFAPLISGLLTEEVNAAVSRAKRNTIAYMLMVFLTVAGIIFLLIAAYLALALSVGKVNSALIMAAGCLVIALISFIINNLLESVRRRRLQRQRAMADSSTALTAAALATIPVLLKRPALAVALPLIGIAGYLLFSGANNRKKPRKD